MASDPCHKNQLRITLVRRILQLLLWKVSRRNHLSSKIVHRVVVSRESQIAARNNFQLEYLILYNDITLTEVNTQHGCQIYK